MGIKARQMLEEGEIRLLNNSLRKCNRTAIIHTESSCIRLASEMRAEGYQHVFVGKEAYASNVATAYSLKGAVPRYVIRRIKGIQSSGIWEKWAAFAIGKDVVSSVENAQKPVSMQGNILVICLLLLGGNALSLVAWWTEITYIY